MRHISNISCRPDPLLWECKDVYILGLSSSLLIVESILSMTTLDLCLVCGQPDAQRCRYCRDAAYCSLECQQADWRTHKAPVCPSRVEVQITLTHTTADLAQRAVLRLHYT